ncbi:MAG TPA: histidine phosphatase family protein [Candidatus Krumholzibacteria bacterium]|nr:histidine phosphatase family protein [Candidatus Krumholzibacteria bacterium]
MRIFLARHGETTWNQENRLQGRIDTALSTRGVAQAEALASLLAAQPITAIYTSTLRRSRDTAKPLAARLGLEVRARFELDEMSYGILEGSLVHAPGSEFEPLYTARNADPLAFRPPGGEAYADVHVRLVPFVAELRARHAGEAVLVIGHRATNRVLWALLLERPLAECIALKHKHDRILEFHLGAVPECIEHRYEVNSTPLENP